MSFAQLNKRVITKPEKVEVVDIDSLAKEKTLQDNRKVTVEVRNVLDEGLDVPLSTRASEATLLNLLNEVSFKNKLLQVDTVGNITYLGYANPGTTTASNTWAIKRITETSGDYVIEWADGDIQFDNIWDNRLTLTYS